MSDPQHDTSRLPKWAQTRIDVLERNLAGARAQLTAGPEGSDTFADPYGDSPRPLGSGPVIRFGGAGYEGTFDVRWRSGDLIIQGNAGGGEMVIKPQAANTIRVTIASR